MVGVLRQFHRQVRDACELSVREKAFTRNYTSILWCGQGAAAVVGHIFASPAFQSRIPIVTHTGLELPSFVNSRTLVIAASYSGDAAETVAVAKAAHRTGAHVLCATSGGKLERFAKDSNVAHLDLPGGLLEKNAFPYLFFPLLKLFEQLRLIRQRSEETRDIVAVLAKPQWHEKAHALAEKLEGKVPLIYATDAYRGVGLAWKQFLNETAQLHAFSHTIPNITYGELFAFQKDEPYAVVLLHDEVETGEVRKRVSVTKQRLLAQSMPTTELVLKGSSYLMKLTTAVYLGMLVSYHLALLLDVDPDDLQSREQFEKQLKRAL